MRLLSPNIRKGINMSETTRTESAELNTEAGIAAAATAETEEIINLLNTEASGGSCCGGACCSSN